MNPTASALAWTTEEVRVAGSSVRLRTTGRGWSPFEANAPVSITQPAPPAPRYGA
jgi:hypothetical protein